MWKDDYKRKRIRNIVYAFLTVLLLAGLAVALLTARRKTEEEDAVLIEAYSQQQQQQTQARKEGVNSIQAEYDTDTQTVAEYMPGIVCWGDNITSGSSGNVSFPNVLQKYIDTYICDIYDFSLSIENASDYSRLNWDGYTVDIPVVNMGAGEETTSTVLGRSGAVPYVTSQDIIIPAGLDSVGIYIASQNGDGVAPLTGGSAGVNNVTIAGVEGTLTLDTGSFQSYGVNRYYFTRAVEGEAVTVAAGTVVETAASDMYLDYIHVVCIGTYGGYDSTSELVEQTRQLLERQTSNKERYIVLGFCSVNGYWYSGMNYALDAVDTAMTQAFGNHYINVRKYLCTDGLRDAGLTATADDKEFISLGIVPPSLRSPTGDAELSGKAYQLIGKLVYDRMDTLGYFDEIKEELYIGEARREILRDDSAYFTRMLAEALK